jgi:hypothetical protein
MFRLPLIAIVVLICSALMAEEDSRVDLAGIDRAIVKEPSYQSQPRYALLVFGLHAERRCWLAIDGLEVAYVDRNENGDLTDPDERVELDREATNKIRLGGSPAYKAMHIFPLGHVGGSQLSFHLWVPNLEYDPEQDPDARDSPEVRDYRHDMRTRGWMNGSLMRATKDGMQAQNPLALTTKPEDAQICHMLGPLSFDLKWGANQKLEPWPKKSVFDLNIGTRNLPPRGWTRGGFDFSRLAISEIPERVHPVALFEHPASGPNEETLRREVTLDQRCCGDTVYAIVTLPQEAAAGNVKIHVTFPLWLGHAVEDAHFEVPINQAQSTFGEVAYIMFHDPAIELKHAVNALRRQKVDVSIQDDALQIIVDGEPALGVTLNRAPEVLETARGLADGTGFDDRLRTCDARFEVGPYDAGQAELLLKVQGILLELTDGVAYQTWDKQLSAAQ